ncbi:MAG: F0F1 ATP synthase subunit beta, partial [Firmicutes bacterium]|nr:F0F1 ATP synthase subunit beta [Bacillota bacterium]
MATGKIRQIIGAVVDVEFPAEQLPDIYNAIQVKHKIGDEEKTLVMEAMQHLGNNEVRCVALASTDGLQR